MRIRSHEMHLPFRATSLAPAADPSGDGHATQRLPAPYLAPLSSNSTSTLVRSSAPRLVRHSHSVLAALSDAPLDASHAMQVELSHESVVFVSHAVHAP